MVRQGGLGRGLASLIPPRKKPVQKDINFFGAQGADENVEIEKKDTATQEASASQKSAGLIGDIALKSVIEVPVQSIVSNPYQPRKDFNEEKLQELADSIKVQGLIQPIVVSRKGINEYELIAGERRLEASKIAGMDKIPVVIKKVSDQQKLEMALIENIQRDNLNVIEEARSYKRLQDEFALTQEEIAKQVGKSRSAVANTMRLLSLPIEIQKALSGGKISEGHARTILAISNPEKQRALFELILKENLSVRQVEDKVREVTISTHQRRVRQVDPETREKEEKLSGALGTRVKIKKSAKGGQIAIDYFSTEEFENLFGRLSSLE